MTIIVQRLSVPSSLVFRIPLRRRLISHHGPFIRGGQRSETTRFFATSAVPLDEGASSPSRPAATSEPPPPSAHVSGNDDSTKTHFGFESVKVEDKEGLVRQVFENVADSYDVMNDFMSGGLHRLWKDHFVELTRVEGMAGVVRKLERTRLDILDVAVGTGDIAFRMVEASNAVERAKSSGEDPVSITVCDINAQMLSVGKERANAKFGNALLQDTKSLSFVQGNAQALTQFEDNAFDLYTIAFGLRNVTNVNMALKEALRVLKPGGRYMCLEFSQVPDPVLRQMYDTYSFHVIPSLGEWVANDRPSYQYLVESIRKFSNQDELVSRMELAGFQNVKYTNLTGGIVAIHEGWKPLS